MVRRGYIDLLCVDLFIHLLLARLKGLIHNLFTLQLKCFEPTLFLLTVAI